MPLLRQVTRIELREMYRHMERDFPANERLPFFMVRDSILHGRLKAVYLTEETGEICGYALCVLPSENYYQIQYIAILPEHRSKGYGSLFLQLLGKRYDGRHVILEVEDPELAADEEARVMREKRIAFYRRAGLRVIENMSFYLFGIRMLCMTDDPRPVEHAQELWETSYLKAAGSRWILRFIKVVLHQEDLGQHAPADQAAALKIPLGIYRHYKGGEYRVLSLARHSETLETVVVYQALYGEKGVWVRPASMWNEMVHKDGTIGPRFTYIGRDVE